MTEENALPIASMQKRMASFVIDDIIISLFFLIIFYDQLAGIAATAGAAGEMSQAVTEASISMMNDFVAQNLVVFLSIKVIYHTVLVWQNGMTIGKYLVKIKVISVNTQQRPNFQQAFLRASVRLISDSLFYLGYIMAFFMPLRQTLHDKLSQCVVVYA